MDLRKEAEYRAQQHERNCGGQRTGLHQTYSIGSKKYPNNRPSGVPKELTENSSDNNETPKVAYLKELDYKWNGFRARALSGEFIVPRWVPDEEVTHCDSCNSEFDWVNRRHHCRHCGKVFCEQCVTHQDMLPHEYGYRDPCKVCNNCHILLEPYQSFLSTNIANHQRNNSIDIASTNCNVRRYFNMPYSMTLGSEIRKAAYSTHNLFQMDWVRDKAIPLRLLAQAKGLAFLTVIKGGFIFAPRIGTGLVIARLASGKWSAPSAIGTVGLSWGAVAGLDITDYVVILNTNDAVAAFSGSGQLTVGAGIEVAVGPVGRSGSAELHISETGLAPAFSYSHSRGLFAGISLDGALILARHDVNHKFYGRAVKPLEILGGSMPIPRAASPLYNALREAQSSLPDVKHVVPSRTVTMNTAPQRLHDDSAVVGAAVIGMEMTDLCAKSNTSSTFIADGSSNYNRPLQRQTLPSSYHHKGVLSVAYSNGLNDSTNTDMANEYVPLDQQQQSSCETSASVVAIDWINAPGKSIRDEVGVAVLDTAISNVHKPINDDQRQCSNAEMKLKLLRNRQALLDEESESPTDSFAAL